RYGNGCRRSGIYYKKHPHHRPSSSRHDDDTEIPLNPKRVRSTILSSKAVSMAKPAPITIPTEPIGSIPRPVDLIERIAKGYSEDPSLAPLYDDAIRDTIERFETTGSPASLLAESEASRRGTTR